MFHQPAFYYNRDFHLLPRAPRNNSMQQADLAIYTTELCPNRHFYTNLQPAYGITSARICMLSLSSEPFLPVSSLKPLYEGSDLCLYLNMRADNMSGKVHSKRSTQFPKCTLFTNLRTLLTLLQVLLYIQTNR